MNTKCFKCTKNTKYINKNNNNYVINNNDNNNNNSNNNSALQISTERGQIIIIKYE
jgi:hypothetical protein